MLLQQGDQLVHLDVELGAIFGSSGDDQRSTGFIDEHRVHFIHQRIVKWALDALLWRKRHVVTQIVKAEFVVGTVGDVHCIGFTLLLMIHTWKITAY